MVEMEQFNLILHSVILCTTIEVVAACPENCVCTDSAFLDCAGTIPEAIPRLIRSVDIINPPKMIRNGSFAGGSWDEVVRLSLTTDSSKPGFTNGAIHIGSGAFTGMSSLRNLSITNFISTECVFDRLAFKGIELVQSLNLAKSSVFRPDIVFSAINQSLHNLEVLNLEYVGATHRYTLNLEGVILDALRATKVRVLDISGMNIGSINREEFSSSFPYLEELTMKRLKLNILVDLGSVYIPDPNDISGDCKFPSTLQKLDVSDSEYKIRITFPSAGIFLIGKCFTGLKELTVNNVVDKVSMDGVLIRSESLNTTRLEKLVIMNNGLQKVNASFLQPGKCLSLKQINLANNNISYLAPSFMQRLENLLVFNLSNNALGHMESMDDFEQLFINNTYLEILSLAANGLSNLPRLVFIENTNLLSINLSKNKLVNISFQVNHLLRLKHLDVTNNRMKVLSLDVLSILESLRQKSGNETALRISVANNPFVCTCNSEGIPQIISSYTALFNHSGNSNTFCDFDGTQFRLFAASSKQQISKECGRKTIIIISSVSVVACLAVGVALTFALFRFAKQIRKKRHLLKLMELYANEDIGEQFMVFLSYSSEDCEFVNTCIYKQLDQKLKNILNVENNIELICNGDLHFQAGRRIENEIVKCVESSKVVLLLISKAFCSSPWCDYETVVSYYEKKPIILMFKEDVPTKTMPSVLRKLFHRYVRATWKDVNGAMVMYPGWDKLCEAIIEHADV